MLEFNLENSVIWYNFKVFLALIFWLIFFLIVGFFIILFFGFNAITITLGIFVLIALLASTPEQFVSTPEDFK